MKRHAAIEPYWASLRELAHLIRRQDKDIETVRSQYSGEKLHSADYEEEVERKREIRSEFDADFRRQLLDLAEQVKELRSTQPKLESLTLSNLRVPLRDFPDFIIFRRLRIQKDLFDKTVPLPEEFPPLHAIIMAESGDAAAQVQSILLRLLTCIPLGKLNIMAVDPRNGGASLGELRALLPEKLIFPQRSVVTRDRDIAELIEQLKGTQDERLQGVFSNEYPTWKIYNERHQLLPYTVLVLYDALSQLSSDTCWQLARLIEKGPNTGILPLITYRDSELQDHARKELQPLFSTLSTRQGPPLGENFYKTFSCQIIPETLPPPESLRPVVAAIREAAKVARTQARLEDLWEGVALFGSCSAEGIQAPVGWNEEGRLVLFHVGSGGTLQHTLVAGSTGSGKSNLMHVLIHSLCHAYAPDELELYLLDFKNGVEFKAYGQPEMPLPHARLVATESDAEYGISVLEYLNGVMEQRNQLFKSVGVTSLAEFRKSSPKRMPRILLMVDEFQKLFDDESKLAPQSLQAQKLLKDLLRQARSAGIHVLLSTQTLAGLNATSISELLGQIGCRLVLQCPESDSCKVLSADNVSAARITSPPEGILNCSGGSRDGNIVMTIPRADAQTRQAHLKLICDEARTRGGHTEVKLFDGAELPMRRQGEARAEQEGELCLGLRLEFEEKPFCIRFSSTPQESHLLIAGSSPRLRASLLESLFKWLSHLENIEIICFGQGLLPEMAASEGIRLCNTLDELDLPSLAESRHEHRRVLVLLGVETLSDMEDPSYSQKSSPTSRKALDQILKDGSADDTQVILVATNCKLLASSDYRKLVQSFDRRILFKLPETPARQLCGDASDQIRGLVKDDRALYLQTDTGIIQWFRPFSSPDFPDA